MGDQHCPTRDELAAFRAGTRPVDSFESLARHLESCARCLADLENASDLDNPL
jgi:hypothetical protein